ncbi:hypothetical protein [Chryseobacterium sp. M5A1_1a]
MKTINKISIAKKELEDRVNRLIKSFENANPEVDICFHIDNTYVDNANGESIKIKSEFKADVKIK